MTASFFNVYLIELLRAW